MCEQTALAGYQANRAAIWSAYKSATWAIKIIYTEYKIGENMAAAIAREADLRSCKETFDRCIEEGKENWKIYREQLREYQRCKDDKCEL